MQMWQRVGPVPVQMWQGRAQSRCRCGRGEPSPGAGLQSVPVAADDGGEGERTLRKFGRADFFSGASTTFLTDCGRDDGTLGANFFCKVASERCRRLSIRCGEGEPSPDADVAGVSHAGLLRSKMPSLAP